MSTNYGKSSLEDFKLFYEELVFSTKPKASNRIRRIRAVTAATVK